MRFFILFIAIFCIQGIEAQSVSIKIGEKETLITNNGTIKVDESPSKISFKISPKSKLNFNVVSGEEIKSFDFPADNSFHETQAAFIFPDPEKKSGDIVIKNKADSKELLRFHLQLQEKKEEETDKFTITLDGSTTQNPKNGDNIPVTEKPLSFTVKVNSPRKTFILSSGDEGIAETEFEGDNKPHTINSKNINFNEKGKALIQIKEKDKEEVIFSFFFLNTKINNPKKTNDNGNNSVSLPPFEPFWDSFNFSIEPTQFGLILKSGNTKFIGKQYVHIFLDQYGNSLFGTIPQGIADRQYVVHVFYLTGSANDLHIYDIKKTKGTFSPALNYLNSDIKKSTESEAAAGKISEYTWVHREFILGTSTSDIEFELTNTTIQSADAPYAFKNEKAATYTINMTPTYHGSFNVGFVNSHLENPSFELVENPANSDEEVVKKTGAGNRGIMTVMATVYTSPIVLIEKLFKADIPWNKTYGRNFLDDHKLFERFYPVLGVGFTDKTLENIFYGMNWEVTRGAGLFFGWHWGKVNTFRTDGGFEFEKTPTGQAEFDLRTNEQWKTRFSIGFNIDPFVVARLLSVSLK
jgi:hypothetical protein